MLSTSKKLEVFFDGNVSRLMLAGVSLNSISSVFSGLQEQLGCA
jgi:hypothetical protein